MCELCMTVTKRIRIYNAAKDTFTNSVTAVETDPQIVEIVTDELSREQTTIDSLRKKILPIGLLDLILHPSIHTGRSTPQNEHRSIENQFLPVNQLND